LYIADLREKRKIRQTLGMRGPGGVIPFGVGPVFPSIRARSRVSLLFMKQRMSMIDMSELPNLLSLDAVSGSKNQIKGGGAEQQSA
jgi:hypothetical protein